MKSKFLVIIPARGGSKGIKNKNIVKLNGKPLISYTIEPALKLKKRSLVDKVIVSTDSKRIADIAKKCCAEAPFLRPKKLASDSSKTVDVVLHAVDYFAKKGIHFDAVVLLQPTCPLRTLGDIKKAIELYNRSSADSLISAYKESVLSNLIMYRRKDNFALPFNKKHNQGTRRQQQDTAYVRNGAIYVAAVKFLKKTRRIISAMPLLYEMPKSRSLNLDTKEDLKLLRCILRK